MLNCSKCNSQNNELDFETGHCWSCGRSFDPWREITVLYWDLSDYALQSFLGCNKQHMIERIISALPSGQASSLLPGLALKVCSFLPDGYFVIVHRSRVQLGDDLVKAAQKAWLGPEASKIAGDALLEAFSYGLNNVESAAAGRCCT